MNLLARAILGALLLAGGVAEGPAAPPPEAGPASAGGQDPGTEARPAPSPPGGDLEEFVPSEEIPLDSAVSFPVDI
jgi:hypothetical protein